MHKYYTPKASKKISIYHKVEDKNLILFITERQERCIACDSFHHSREKNEIQTVSVTQKIVMNSRGGRISIIASTFFLFFAALSVGVNFDDDDDDKKILLG